MDQSGGVILNPSPPFLNYIFTPVVPLLAAAPTDTVAVKAAALATTSPEYVYLLVVVVKLPSANIPSVELPAAEP